MTQPGRIDRPAENGWQGLPQTAHSALTPVGEIEQAGKIAAGFRNRRDGWRRWIVLIGAVVLGIAAVATAVAMLFSPAGG
jgi:hypothetical protein